MYLFLTFACAIFFGLALAAWLADREWSWPNYEWEDTDEDEYFDHR